jgi:kumamolisin
MPKKTRQSARTRRSTARVVLPGSDRKPAAGAKVVGKVDASQRIEITVQLRRRPGANLNKKLNEIYSQRLQQGQQRTYLTRQELENLGGADPKDVASVDAFAHQNKLSVSEVSIPRRTVKLTGTVSDFSSAFGVKLKRFKSGKIAYRGRTGAIYVPKQLQGVVERVLGLDDRPVFAPHYRFLPPSKKAQSGRRAKAGKVSGRVRASDDHGLSSFSPIDVAKIYDFPTGMDGSGQTIALIELNDIDNQGNSTGVGYAQSDLDSFFSGLNLTTPQVASIGVDGGANLPGPDPGGDGEVTLDIEVAGAVAPGSNIAVYFGTNTTDGFIQALTTAIHDDVRKPSVISISWGGTEESSTQQLLDGLDQALQEAAALGVTVCAAAGDNGSADMLQKDWDGKPHADFPASDPFVLACGGTTLQSTQTGKTENVWNGGAQFGATGGGVSNAFPKPSYQSHINVPAPANKAGGRGLPDVAGNADPRTGYNVFVGGGAQVIGGTSAVAPLWAGLIALLNQNRASQNLTPVGFLNAELYALPASSNAFTDIINGNNDIYNDLNGKYSAAAGWDPCTGFGTPDGAQLMAALTGGTGTAPTSTSRVRAKASGG